MVYIIFGVYPFIDVAGSFLILVDLVNTCQYPQVNLLANHIWIPRCAKSAAGYGAGHRYGAFCRVAVELIGEPNRGFAVIQYIAHRLGRTIGRPERYDQDKKRAQISFLVVEYMQSTPQLLFVWQLFCVLYGCPVKLCS